MICSHRWREEGIARRDAKLAHGPRHVYCESCGARARVGAAWELLPSGPEGKRVLNLPGGRVAESTKPPVK